MKKGNVKYCMCVCVCVCVYMCVCVKLNMFLTLSRHILLEIYTYINIYKQNLRQVEICSFPLIESHDGVSREYFAQFFVPFRCFFLPINPNILEILDYFIEQTGWQNLNVCVFTQSFSIVYHSIQRFLRVLIIYFYIFI